MHVGAAEETQESQILRRACNVSKPTHSGNHNQGSSCRGANHLWEVGEVTGKGAGVRQVPRSQPALALTPLRPLPHTWNHKVMKWVSQPGNYLRLHPTQSTGAFSTEAMLLRQGVKAATSYTETNTGRLPIEESKKHGLNERTDQNARKRTEKKWS